MTDDAVVEILRTIQADLAAVKTDVAAHTRMFDLLQQDTTLIRGVLTVTPGRSTSYCRTRG